MKALFIGGTGTISSAISRLVPLMGWDLYLLNRGNRKSELKGVKYRHISCDVRAEDEGAVRKKLEKALKNDKVKCFDVVADFISFVPEHIQKDLRVFEGICKQFIFISSASAYQKPLSSPIITESTPLANPFWQYSRDKIACENLLMEKYRESSFPFTIVRPSHTYDERSVPLGVHGRKGSWQVVKRMIEGKPVIIHGDGSSLWTMTHNSDFARGFERLMGNIHAIGEAVHITSDESLTWNQIYQTIADCLGVKLKAAHIASDFLDECSSYDFHGGLLGDKANSVIFDNTKLKRLAGGFKAQVRFDEGIRRTLSHVLSHPALQEEDPEFDEWCDKIIAARDAAAKGLRNT
jgi:nucleoside-diphosphate-sugar epimerase